MPVLLSFDLKRGGKKSATAGTEHARSSDRLRRPRGKNVIGRKKAKELFHIRVLKGRKGSRREDVDAGKGVLRPEKPALSAPAVAAD